MKRTAEAFVKELAPEAAALLSDLVRRSDEDGLAVFAVGGPVRDWLLGRAVRDLDILVEGADAADLAARSMPADARTTRHDRFGTATLQVGEYSFDIASTRTETYAHPGALPRVESGSLEDDLRRRDFSVNALALPLSRNARASHSGLVDPADGLSDLEKRQLRVLHGKSFEDDPTRALRAARLAPRLGFSLARGSRTALNDALRGGAFGRVSGDRLRRELVKVCDDAVYGLDPSRALRLLDGWHVLAALEPGLHLPRESVVPLRRLGRALAAPPWGRPGRWRGWVSALEIWLAPMPPALRRRSLRRFAVRGDRADRIAGFPKAREGWLRGLAKARGRGAIDAVLAGLVDDELHALHACAEPTARRRIERFANEDRIRRLPVSGDDLVGVGLSGPAVGRALRRIRTAFLDGTVHSRDEALALASEIARRRSVRDERKSKPRSK